MNSPPATPWGLGALGRGKGCTQCTPKTWFPAITPPGPPQPNAHRIPALPPRAWRRHTCPSFSSAKCDTICDTDGSYHRDLLDTFRIFTPGFTNHSPTPSASPDLSSHRSSRKFSSKLSKITYSYTSTYLLF